MNPGELNCDLKMECQSISELTCIPFKTSNIRPNILQRTKKKDCVLRFLLPKSENSDGYCQYTKSDFYVPDNSTIGAPLVQVAKSQDPKREDFKKRLIEKSYIILNPKQSKTPVVDVNMLEESEDVNLLPSKRDNRKSEITLIPVKPKACGCSGPCEIIICEVIVQQYVDNDEVSFMLAMNIEEDEIDACVVKHCNDEYCDTLSIDHDRCRRGLIQLYKCDRSNVCDICGTTMNGWRSRLYHKKCEKREEYRHNNVSQERLLRDRFRLRELQILDDARIRKKNYLDPVNGPALALEAIRKNQELMIIPQTKPSPKPILTITTIPSSTPTNVVSQSIPVNSQASNPKNTVSNIITIRPCNNVALSSNGTPSHLKENVAQQMDPVQSPSAQHTYIMTSTGTLRTTVTSVPRSQYIHLTNSTTAQPTTISNLTVSQSTTTSNLGVPQPTTTSNLIVPQPTTISNLVASQPTTINNLIVAQPHVVANSSAQPKPLLAPLPIRVMPITNLKTAPSLLHREQGIPQYCIIAGNMITTLTKSNMQALNSIIASNFIAQQQQVAKAPTNTPKAPANTPKAPAKSPIQKRRCLSQKRVISKKPSKHFFCVYCCKHFSTDWYFKKHVARHVKEKHTPQVSIRPHSDTLSHTSDVQEELDYACDSPYSSIKSSTDRVDGETEVHEPCVQLEYDTEDCDEDFADKTNNCTMVDDFNEIEEKKIKCEEIFDTWNGNVEIFRNGIKIEAQDDVYFEDVPLEEHAVNESFNENCNAEGNDFTIGNTKYVIGNIKSENFEEENVTVTLR